MAETPQQIVDRVLREHKRYTGDGLPNEPVNAPLPVGDPQSGPYNPKKKDLRLGLKETLHGAAEETARASDEADRAEAAAAIAQQGGSGLAEFETRALAEAWPGVDPMPESIVIRGDVSAEDGLGGTFVLGQTSDDTITVNGETYGRVKDVSTSLRLKADRLIDAPALVQKKMMEARFGYNDEGGGDTQIYPGAQRAAQAIAWAEIGGAEYIWIAQRCVLPNYSVDERHRIVQFLLLEDGSVGDAIAFSQELNLGHVGGLGVLVDGSGAITLISTSPTEAGHEGTDSGKGISIINWRGSSTSQADVTAKQLFGYEGSGHPLETFYQSAPAISSDGSLLAVHCNRKPLGGPYNPSVYSAVLIYSLGEIINASNPLSVKPLHIWGVNPPRGYDLQVRQGIAINKDCVAIMWGFASAFTAKAVQFFSLDGSPIREIRPSLQASEYGIDGLLNHPTLGVNSQMEPEGLCFRGDDELLTIILDTWVNTGDVVTVEGRNYVVTAAETSDEPYNPRGWSPTTKPATKGEWTPGTYSRPAGANRRSKVVWSIRVPKGDVGEKALYESMGGFFYNLTQADLKHNTAPDIEWLHGTVFQVASYSPQYDRHFHGFTYSDSHFRVYDPDTEDTRNAYVRMVKGRDVASFGLSSGGALNVYGPDDETSAAGALRFFNLDNGFWQISTGETPTLRPGMPGQNIGSDSNRVGTIRLQNPPDVSSDERLKSTLQPLAAAEISAAQELAGAISVYELLSDPGLKHVGLGAQTVIAIMQKHGLDPLAYRMIQHGTWGEEPEIVDGDGRVEQRYRPAGEAYSLAYEQVAMFIQRGLHQLLLIQERRLLALEAKCDG